MAFFKDNTHFMNMKTAKMKLLLSSLSKCKRQFFCTNNFCRNDHIIQTNILKAKVRRLIGFGRAEFEANNRQFKHPASYLLVA